MDRFVWSVEDVELLEAPVQKAILKMRKEMIIVAKRGTSDYLVSTGNDRGKVVMLEDKVVSKDINIHSVLARGYWKEYTGDADETKRVMEML